MSYYGNRIRLLRLSEFAAHTRTEWLDRTVCVGAHRVLHLWLMTNAVRPSLTVVGKYGEQFEPVRRVRGRGKRFVYLGKTRQMAAGGYCACEVRGIRAGADVDDVLMLSLDRQPPTAALRNSRTLAELERALWGISRQDVGTTAMLPSRLCAGASEPLLLSYTPGLALPRGTRIRFVVEAFLLDPRAESRFKVVKGRQGLRFLCAERIAKAKRGFLFSARRKIPAGSPIVVRFYPSRAPAFPCAPAQSANELGFDVYPGFMIEVSRDGGHNYVTPSRVHSLQVLSGAPERLELFLPGRRRSGNEPIVCGGLWEDRFGNVPPAPTRRVPEFDLVLNGQGARVRPLGSAADYLIDRYRLRIPLPRLGTGIYRIKAIPRDPSIASALSNPMEVTADPAKAPIYWAGLHAHTEMSDGFDPYPAAFRRARDEAMLDVAAVADHAGYFTENEWHWMQDVTDNWNADERFVTLIAYEWNRSEFYEGKRTSFDINVYSRYRIPRLTGMVPLVAGFRRLAKVPGIVLGTHHAGPRVLDVWRFCGARQLIRFFEVCSVFGVFDGDTGANGLFAQGERIGLIGGGDSHIGYCALGPRTSAAEREKLNVSASSTGQPFPTGITAILAPRLTRAHVLEALRRGRVYASTGARLLIDFSVSGVPMGGSGRAVRPFVTADAHGCAPIRRVQIIRDGNVVREVGPEALDVHVRWADTSAGCGWHYYYLKVIQADGEQGWTTPVWLRRIRAGCRRFESADMSAHSTTDLPGNQSFFPSSAFGSQLN